MDNFNDIFSNQNSLENTVKNILYFFLYPDDVQNIDKIRYPWKFFIIFERDMVRKYIVKIVDIFCV